MNKYTTRLALGAMRGNASIICSCRLAPFASFPKNKPCKAKAPKPMAVFCKKFRRSKPLFKASKSG